LIGTFRDMSKWRFVIHVGHRLISGGHVTPAQIAKYRQVSKKVKKKLPSTTVVVEVRKVFVEK
jgi:hypothetical protein